LCVCVRAAPHSALRPHHASQQRPLARYARTGRGRTAVAAPTSTGDAKREGVSQDSTVAARPSGRAPVLWVCGGMACVCCAMSIAACARGRRCHLPAATPVCEQARLFQAAALQLQSCAPPD
jgi:hypothetical protein